MKKTGKTLENCSFTSLYRQKQDHPKIKFTFFLKITDGDDKLSRTFYFIKTSYVLAGL